jgi:hypothetical protein
MWGMKRIWQGIGMEDYMVFVNGAAEAADRNPKKN